MAEIFEARAMNALELYWFMNTDVIEGLLRTSLNTMEGCVGFTELTPTIDGENVVIGPGYASVARRPYRNTAPISFPIPTPSVGTTGHRVVLRADTGASTVGLVLKSSADGTATFPEVTYSGGVFEIGIARLTITTDGVKTLTDTRTYSSVFAPCMPSRPFYSYPGAPASGASGYLLNIARVGDLLTDTSNGKLYICNASTSSSITWVSVGGQS